MTISNVNSTNSLDHLTGANVTRCPVQYCSVLSGNQTIPEESGNSKIKHQSSVEDPAHECQQGANVEVSSSSIEITTPQQIPFATPASESPASVQFPFHMNNSIPYGSPYLYPMYSLNPLFYPFTHSNYYQGTQLVNMANSGQHNDMHIKEGVNDYSHKNATEGVPSHTYAPNLPYQQLLVTFQQIPTNGYTFLALRNDPKHPKAPFSLRKISSPHEYNDWLRDFCKELRNQGLEHTFPTAERHYFSIELTEEETEYITTIHNACVPLKSFPSWFKAKIKRDISLIICFLQAVQRMIDEQNPMFIFHKIDRLSMNDGELIEDFTARVWDLYLKAKKAGISRIEKTLAVNLMNSLPDGYESLRGEYIDGNTRLPDLLSEINSRASNLQNSYGSNKADNCQRVTTTGIAIAVHKSAHVSV